MGEPRSLLWLASAATLVLLLGVWLLAQAQVSTAAGSRVVSDLAVTAAAGFAALMAARNARRRPLRTAWAFAAFCALYAGGQVCWTFLDLLDLSPPWASGLDVVFLLATSLALFGATTLPVWPRGVALVRLVLDGLLIAISLWFSVWVFFSQSLSDHAPGPLGGLVGLAYPVLDAAVVTVLVLALPRMTPRSRPGAYLALIAMLLIGSSDARSAYLPVGSHVATGGAGDLGWVLGFGLLALAATRWRSGPDRVVTAEPDELRSVLLLLPYPFVLSGVATALWAITVGPGLDNGSIAIGLVSFITMVARQVATLMESEQRAQAMTHQATHDQLTGLRNRANFREYLDTALRRGDGPVTVLFIDVDDFKDLNDSFGHSVGDDVLRRLSVRLRACLKDADTVARLGGDEFGVALDGVGPRQAVEIADRIAVSLSAPMTVKHEQRSVSVSVGVAISDADCDTAELLLRNADLAMYEAKRGGRNRCAMYAPPMHTSVLAWTELVQQLETALERGEFRVHYQPEFDLSTGAVVGAEALLRWQHPDRGLLAPEAFLAAADRSGFILKIGAWVLERGCQFTGGLMSEQLVSPSFHLAVNVAPDALKDLGLADQFARCLAKGPMRPHQIVAEITESAFVDAKESLPTLWRLRELGVKIAIDDFGTGYSSLSYLDRFPVDVLKIDKSFVDDVDRSLHRKAIVKAIVDMAATLRLTTVAEGIERQSQLTTLSELGCQRGQGYFLARPLDEAAFVALLSEATAPDMAPRGVTRRPPLGA